jgi:16S rRNA (guanine527-N7)-methyltransferase
VGNAGDVELLREGARALEIELSPDVAEALLRFREELLKWNQKFNLTSITDPREVLEKHFLDSLAVLPEVGDRRSLLDVGAGGGFPGLPLRLARPALDVTLVDTVGKKVVFMKNAIARLGLGGSARAVQARVEGAPEQEGLPRVEVAVSRAFRDVRGWVPLGSRYLAEGGRVVSMLGQRAESSAVASAAAASGLRLASERMYRLPWSGAERAVLVFER